MCWKRSYPNCNGNRRDKMALYTTCTNKVKIIKIRLSLYRILLLQRKPTLGRTKSPNGPRVGHSWFKLRHASKKNLSANNRHQSTYLYANSKAAINFTKVVSQTFFLATVELTSLYYTIWNEDHCAAWQDNTATVLRFVFNRLFEIMSSIIFYH